MIRLPEFISHQNAQHLRDEGLKALKDSSERVVDGSALVEFDSSTLAVLLAWKRECPELVVEHAPAKLQTLARVYGLTDLFEFKKT